MSKKYQDDTLKIFSLNGNRPLAEKIAKVFGTELGKSVVKQFSDGEISINIEESIRGDHVYIVQSTNCLLYTSPSPRDGLLSRMPSSA